MKPKTVLSLLAIAAVIAFGLVPLFGCTPEAAPTVVNVTQTVITGPGSTSATPTPVPGSGVVAFVRVGLFGGRCPDGSSIAAGATSIRKGCTGYATATPLGQGDVKLPVEVHGYEVDWTPKVPDVVQLLAPENPFNRDVVALNVGTQTITATVKNVTGKFDLTVTP